MRKLSIVAGLAMLALAGCERNQDGTIKYGESLVSVYTDPKTGCEYLVRSSASPPVPRVGTKCFPMRVTDSDNYRCGDDE